MRLTETERQQVIQRYRISRTGLEILKALQPDKDFRDLSNALDEIITALEAEPIDEGKLAVGIRELNTGIFNRKNSN